MSVPGLSNGAWQYWNKAQKHLTMINPTVFLLALTLLHVAVWAQPDGDPDVQPAELLGKPYHQKLEAIHRFYGKVLDFKNDTVGAYAAIDQLRQAARQYRDNEAVLEADLLEALFDFRGKTAPLKKMYHMAQQGREQRVLHIACRATYVIALHHWDDEQYELSFRWYASLDSLLQQVTVTEFPNKVAYLQEIGEKYMRFGDFPRAMAYFEQVVSVPRSDFYERDWKHAMNNMGLVFQQQDSLDRADECFNKVLTRNTKDSEIWEGIVSGNLGYCQYLREKYAAAIPLFQRDIDIAIKYGDFALAAGSAIPMADILIRQRLLPQAKSYIDSAYVFIHRSGQTDRLRRLFPVMSKWYAASGNPDRSARYMDSAITAGEQYHRKFNALQMLRANQSVMASQREAALQQLRADSHREINRRNMILAGLILLAVLGVFWAYKQRKANEIKLKDRDLQLLAADRELQKARYQLNEFARTMAEKNQLLEAHAKAEKTKENSDLIEQLTKQVVLTNEDWIRFSTLFGKVYPGFQHQLKLRYPALTPAEIRCLAMEKLYFSNSEMAALQGISTNAVMVTKHRIRKKLGFSSHAELVGFVHSL